MEPVEVLNKRLIEYFSIAWNGWPIWRIVFSDNQFEKRQTFFTDSGLQLLEPEVRLLPKYRQWIQHKWVLERLTIVPEIHRDELPNQISYEPIYVFEDGQGNPLPPKWEATKFVIDSLLAVAGQESMGPKYIDPESTPETAMEMQTQRIKVIEEGLFGNETAVGDALAHKQAIIVPGGYES